VVNQLKGGPIAQRLERQSHKLFEAAPDCMDLEKQLTTCFTPQVGGSRSKNIGRKSQVEDGAAISPRALSD